MIRWLREWLFGKEPDTKTPDPDTERLLQKLATLPIRWRRRVGGGYTGETSTKQTADDRPMDVTITITGHTGGRGEDWILVAISVSCVRYVSFYTNSAIAKELCLAARGQVRAAETDNKRAAVRDILELLP